MKIQRVDDQAFIEVVIGVQLKPTSSLINKVYCPLMLGHWYLSSPLYCFYLGYYKSRLDFYFSWGDPS